MSDLMVKTAFIVIRSPQELDPSKVIGNMSEKDDSTAILFEDAVYNAVLADRAEKLRGVVSEVKVARDDLEARGFSGEDLKIGRTVEYGEIVETIMESTDRTVSV